MTAFDYLVIATVAVSVIISVWRGAIREVLALLSWVIAFFVAQAHADTVASLLPASVQHVSMRLLIGFCALFVGVLVLTALVGIVVAKLLAAVGLGPLDRGIGAIFGLLRGMLAVLIVVLLCGLTAAPMHPVWREAMLSPPFEALAVSVKPLLPDDLSRHISYP
jgi:membrane protein required for colicin V production